MFAFFYDLYKWIATTFLWKTEPYGYGLALWRHRKKRELKGQKVYTVADGGCRCFDCFSGRLCSHNRVPKCHKNGSNPSQIVVKLLQWFLTGMLSWFFYSALQVFQRSLEANILDALLFSHTQKEPPESAEIYYLLHKTGLTMTHSGCIRVRWVRWAEKCGVLRITELPLATHNTQFLFLMVIAKLLKMMLQFASSKLPLAA